MDAEGIAPSRWLERLVVQLPKARAGGDPEGTHQTRVALGRLRVWLQLGGWRVLDDDLAWARRHVGAVRDYDVGIARRPPQAVLDVMLVEREHAQRALQIALDQPRLTDAIAALECLPPIPLAVARRRTRQLAARALRGAKRAFDAHDDWEALHAERRAMRRLRYALEWMDESAACPRRIVELVDALGELGDVWLAREHADHAQADASYRRQLERQTIELTRAAVQRWHRCRPLLEEIARWTST